MQLCQYCTVMKTLPPPLTLMENLATLVSGSNIVLFGSPLNDKFAESNIICVNVWLCAESKLF